MQKKAKNVKCETVFRCCVTIAEIRIEEFPSLHKMMNIYKHIIKLGYTKKGTYHYQKTTYSIYAVLVQTFTRKI